MTEAPGRRRRSRHADALRLGPVERRQGVLDRTDPPPRRRRGRRTTYRGCGGVDHPTVARRVGRARPRCCRTTFGTAPRSSRDRGVVRMSVQRVDEERVATGSRRAAPPAAGPVRGTAPRSRRPERRQLQPAHGELRRGRPVQTPPPAAPSSPAATGRPATARIRTTAVASQRREHVDGTGHRPSARRRPPSVPARVGPCWSPPDGARRAIDAPRRLAGGARAARDVFGRQAQVVAQPAVAAVSCARSITLRTSANGVRPAVSPAAPVSTSAPASVASRQASIRRRLLPSPASPVTCRTVVRRWPASATAADTMASSEVRPTNGSSPTGGVCTFHDLQRCDFSAAISPYA